jgi:hypothetical protein
MAGTYQIRAFFLFFVNLSINVFSLNGQGSHMHTDEFEISLLRELRVCGNTIQRIKKTLILMEQKHHKTTETFVDEYRSGRLKDDPDNRDDYAAWQSSYESLLQWKDLERQYQEKLSIMKVSGGKSSSRKQKVPRMD